MNHCCAITREKEARKALRLRLETIPTVTMQEATAEGFIAVTTGFSTHYLAEVEALLHVLEDMASVPHRLVKVGKTLEVWRLSVQLNPFRS
jgi:hypothetical protein